MLVGYEKNEGNLRRKDVRTRREGKMEDKKCIQSNFVITCPQGPTQSYFITEAHATTGVRYKRV